MEKSIHTKKQKLFPKIEKNFYFTDDKCQYWLNKVDRTLTSTNHMNLNCTWFLAADEGFYVNLEISKVEVGL